MMLISVEMQTVIVRLIEESKAHPRIAQRAGKAFTVIGRCDLIQTVEEREYKPGTVFEGVERFELVAHIRPVGKGKDVYRVTVSSVEYDNAHHLGKPAPRWQCDCRDMKAPKGSSGSKLCKHVLGVRMMLKGIEEVGLAEAFFEKAQTAPTFRKPAFVGGKWVRR